LFSTSFCWRICWKIWSIGRSWHVIFKVAAKGKKTKCKAFPISHMDAHTFTEFILGNEDEYD
jgi:hypothetical protein